MLSVVLMVGYSCSLCGSTVGCQNHSVSYGKSMLVVSRDKHATCTISIHVCRMMARIICSISVHEHNGRLTICWQSARDANPQSTALVAIDMRTDIRHAVAARQNSHTKASFMHKYEVAIHSLSVCNANEIHISITHLYIYKFNPIYFVSLFSWSRSCHRIFSLAFTYVQFAIIMNALLECAQVMKIQYRNAVWLCLPFCTWLCVYYAALARSLACLVEGDTTHGPNLLFTCICYNYANTKHIVCVCVFCAMLHWLTLLNFCTCTERTLTVQCIGTAAHSMDFVLKEEGASEDGTNCHLLRPLIPTSPPRAFHQAPQFHTILSSCTNWAFSRYGKSPFFSLPNE